MPPSTPAAKRVIIPRYANLPNESTEMKIDDEDSDENDISAMTVNDVLNTIETSEKWLTNLLIGKSEINFKI